jgi:hypothetical protein
MSNFPTKILLATDGSREAQVAARPAVHRRSGYEHLLRPPLARTSCPVHHPERGTTWRVTGWIGAVIGGTAVRK